eukprot:10591239-Alexandrium_andersonii.AAC.1
MPGCAFARTRPGPRPVYAALTLSPPWLVLKCCRCAAGPVGCRLPAAAMAAPLHGPEPNLSLIHISEPTRLALI